MSEESANTPRTVAAGNPDKPWRWKPGVSGNPNGRPKDQFSFMGILRSALAEENKSGKSVGERIIARYIKLALAGNGQALEALVARIDGKPAQSLTLKGDSPEPLHVRHSARLEQVTKPKLPAPEQEQEAGDGEVMGERRHPVSLEPQPDTETALGGTGGDTEHQAPDGAEEGSP